MKKYGDDDDDDDGREKSKNTREKSECQALTIFLNTFK